MKRETACKYGERVSRANTPQTPPSLSHLASAPPVPLLPITSDTRGSRQRELELMHYWSTVTYETILQDPDSAANRDRIQRVIPQLALSHDYLLDALLSVTSLHLAFMRPHKALTYAETALRYQNSAFASFRLALSSVSRDVCQAQALFFSSVLTGIVTLALPRACPAFSDRSPTATVMATSEMWRGTAAVLDLTKDVLGDERFRALFPEPEMKETENNPLIIDPGFEDISQKLCSCVLEHTPDDASPDDNGRDQREIYMGSIEELRKCFVLFKELRPLSGVFHWPAIVTPEFMILLKLGQPLARLVVICYAVLLHGVNDRWFAKDAGRQLFEEVSPLIRCPNKDWVDVLSWARERIGPPKSREWHSLVDNPV